MRLVPISLLLFPLLALAGRYDVLTPIIMETPPGGLNWQQAIKNDQERAKSSQGQSVAASSGSSLDQEMLKAKNEGVAYKCTRMDGVSFYRANPCPAKADIPVWGSVAGTGQSVSGDVSVPVTQTIVPRSQACTGITEQRQKLNARPRPAFGQEAFAAFAATMDKQVSSLCN